MNIRNLKKEDAGQVAILIKQLTCNIVEEDGLVERIESLSKSENWQYLVAEIDDKIVGFGGLAWYPIPSKGLMAWIEEVVVSSDHRRQGIGKKIMDELLKITKEKGCVQIKLTTSNPGARKLYEKLGFKLKEKSVLMKKTIFNNS